MNKTFPALSVQQPWAELIISGRKQMEIRSWYTSYRGNLWLHTGRKRNLTLEKFYSLKNLYTGGFIGVVQLNIIIPIDRQRWETMKEKHLVPGEFLPGLYGWVITNPRRFINPIPGAGQLRLFYPDGDVLKKLNDITYL